MAKGSKGFGGYEEAMEMRDIINEIVRFSLDQNRPVPTYARVYTIDAVSRTCMVVINGDTVAVKATCGSIIPSAVDQIVRLEGPPGARYIADVLGPDRVAASTFEDAPWLTPTLGSGVTNIAANPLRYRVVNDRGSRKVQFRGAANLTSAVTTLLTLPAGVWRSAATQLLASRNSSSGAHAVGLVVGTNGAHVLDGKTTGVDGTATSNSAAVNLPSAGAGESSQPVRPPNVSGTYAATSYISGGTANAQHFHNFDHVHNIGTHTHAQVVHSHPLPSVVAPSSIYLDGIEYFL